MHRYAEVLFNIPVDRAFVYCVPDGLHCQEGCRVVAPFGRRRLTGIAVGMLDEGPVGDFQTKDLERVIDSTPVLTPELLRLADWMAETYICSRGEALHAMTPTGRRESEGVDLSLYSDRDAWGPVSLAEEQERAVETIRNARGGTFYLQGVTGSGKTEVFLRVARAVHAEGRSVVYLVPEISLVHQVVERFVAEFGEGVAVLHSGLTGAQRYREWLKLLTGEARVAIGARSAVFAPVLDLGLVSSTRSTRDRTSRGTPPATMPGRSRLEGAGPMGPSS